MAGLYLHIPFCRKACHYCNFHFSTRLQNKNVVVNALLTELSQAARNWDLQQFETIYYGGGTPSLLSEEELQRLQAAIAKNYRLSPSPEITLEANPDDINPESLQFWKNAGINRLSIGVQSFREEDLHWMNRAHTASEALSAVSKARDAGFEHFNIDLIYGTPGLSHDAWRQNIETALQLGITHLSAYALTVESKTALDSMIRRHQAVAPDPEQQAEQFLLLSDRMTEAGWEHYEISNFAVPGHRSRHNSAYWSGAPYLGIGPGAHSFNGKERWWNIANNALYVTGMESGKPVTESELLTTENHFNEYLMTSLRQLEGCSLEVIRSRFNHSWSDELTKDAATFIERGQMELLKDRLVLTREGRLYADGIAAALFRQ
ncbi:radical SAM family heme chaperone HemW [Flavihumibacter petaseus]|uniref:Heme chaperone HemW n=1 Tax=Flavihumibacter petaseus NBRC 106054 TaxID=1220578 RepID=A0A0E9N604_9BACT|nr:radical SAM family heme chaperone HemW [Flavihumibacter petaseus]GAO45131.1 oxygen-independent coproporphyrinogen III oxidase [Flavihumibacter petaseus NBRC 106054]